MKRKILMYLAPVMLAAGCTEGVEQPEPIGGTEEEVVVMPPRNLDEAVFHEGAQGWMIPQKDPYTLDNFRAAYEKLASGNSTQTLTRAEAAEFTDASVLKPTHYALRIFPKNEDEQWKIELMEDVKVAYMPFDYVGLTEDEIKALPVAKTRSGGDSESVQPTDDAVFPESYRYTITYTNQETLEGPVPDQTSILPILYVVWPIDKPLPNEMEYEIDYEIFQPYYEEVQTRALGMSIGMLRSLEAEAIGLALDIPVPERVQTRADGYSSFSGRVLDHDLNLNKDVPMARLGLKWQLGSNVIESSTSSDGSYILKIQVPSIDPLLMLVFYFQDVHGRWKITTENSTAPCVGRWAVYYGIPEWENDVVQDWILEDERPVNEIHRAVQYYYNTQTLIASPYYSRGIRIIADINPPNGAYGLFYPDYNSPNNCRIHIYNAGLPDSYLIGTTFHELGHHNHFCGSPSNLRKIPRFLAESYSSFFGWYLSEQYYKSLGWIKTSNRTEITDQGNQTWMIAAHGRDPEYTPLFVDLKDDFNQTERWRPVPRDEIVGFPTRSIRNIVVGSTSWTNVKRQIIEQVGTEYCTATQLNNYLTDYEKNPTVK